MQLGTGYWSLPAIERRIADLKSRKPRHWRKRLKALSAHRKQLLNPSSKTSLVKGWKGEKARNNRRNLAIRLSKNMTLSEVGTMLGGISRQRVHQIISTRSYE